MHVRKRGGLQQQGEYSRTHGSMLLWYLSCVGEPCFRRARLRVRVSRLINILWCVHAYVQAPHAPCLKLWYAIRPIPYNSGRARHRRRLQPHLPAYPSKKKKRGWMNESALIEA